MRPVHPAWRLCAAAILGGLALLLVLQVAIGLRPVAWLVALGALLTVLLLLARGLARQATVVLGPANRVTLVRAVLTCTVAGLVGQTLMAPAPRPVITGLAAAALALDAVDGKVARYTRTVSRLGARFDMETDALLLLVLSGYVAASVGWWVLLIGLARYLLLAAQSVWPILHGPLRSRRWRKVVAAVQGVVLLVVATDLVPGDLATGLVAGALLLLLGSFASEIAERMTAPATGGGTLPIPLTWSAVGSVLAAALVWVTLVVPAGGSDLSPWPLLRIPVELLVLVAVVLVLPDRGARMLAATFGLVAGVLLVLKVLNLGFALVLDRSFSVVGDLSYLGSAVAVLGDSTGRPLAITAALLAVFVATALVVLLPLASVRTCRLARRHRAPAARVVVGLGALAVVLGATGLDPVPGHGVASASSAQLAVREMKDVRAELRDRAAFADQIAADRFATEPADRLLGSLHGKDVLLVFVESYGRVAVQDSSFAPGIAAVLDAGTRRLRDSGYGSRSAFLTSPTFGAGSWLAHSTLQSGLWVDGQRRYDQLLSARRLTLTEAFHRAGWRTVFDVPAITRDWPQGKAFYGFDTLYDSRNVGYEGPPFGYATMPDQYTLSRFAERELQPAHRPPVMAEIDLVSSHHPWAPLPHLVPWPQVGDGSVFDKMPEQGETAAEVFSDPDRVRAAYGRSVEYTLGSLVSFLTTYHDQNLVVVMLGDHQPHHYVSGTDPGHDVPVTVIARDPDVMARVSDWGWSPGLRPPPEAPVWRMDSFRDRFLSAFSASPLSN